MLGLLALIPVSAGQVPTGAVDASPTSPNLVFIENKGQWDHDAKFLLRGTGFNYWVTNDGVVIDHRSARPVLEVDEDGNRQVGYAPFGQVARVRINGATGSNRVFGQTQLDSKFNFMTGDTATWQSGARVFGAVVNQNVLPGVSARYYVDGGSPRYDLIVRPGGNPGNISLSYEGVDNLRVGSDGSLQYDTIVGTKRESGLFVYQEVDGKRVQVPARWIVNGNNVSFNLGQYDTSKPLVIDPQLVSYSTYFGGTDTDEVRDVTVDEQNGDVIVAGTTASTAATFPETPGVYQSALSGARDIFIARFRNNNRLVAATYIGSSTTSSTVEDDAKVFANGTVTVVFETNGSLPATVAASNGSNIQITADGAKTTANGPDIYIAKLNNDLSTLYAASYYGSPTNAGTETLEDAAVDSQGHVYVVGQANSTGLITTVTGPGQARASARADGFVARFSSRLNSIRAAAYVGGTDTETVYAVAPREDGSVYVAGRTRFRSTDTIGSQTYMFAYYGLSGGFDNTLFNSGTQEDAFVILLDKNFTARALTYFGNAGDQKFETLRLSGSQVIAGGDTTAVLPTTGEYAGTLTGYDRTFGGGDEGMIVRFNNTLDLVRGSTYIGGAAAATGESVDDVAINPTNGQLIAIGKTASPVAPFDGTLTQATFPVTDGNIAGSTARDGFIVRLNGRLNLITAGTFGGVENDEPKAVVLVGPFADALIGGWTESTQFFGDGSATRRVAYQSSLSGVRDGFLTRVAFTSDPVEIQLGQNSIAAGQAQIFGNVFTNAAVPVNTPITLSTNNPALQVIPSTVTVFAGSFRSTQFRVRRTSTTVSVPTNIVISATGSGTTINTTVTLNP